jgi:hypothetical protein
MSTSWLRKGRALAAALTLLALLRAGSARALDAGVVTAPNGGGAATSRLADPRAAHVQALIAGSLDVAIVPQSLFDVALDDEPAIQIERVHLRTLLGALGGDRAKSATPAAARSARPPATAAPRTEIAALDPARWAERVALDSARLAFYELPPEQRRALLEAHAARHDALASQATAEERSAREAEEERQRLLEAADAARSEGERLAREEEARLIGVEQSIASSRQRFRSIREGFGPRRDIVLGWQRRVRDVKSGPLEEADATYDALRRALRASRDELDVALGELDSSSTDVPVVGPDRLGELPPEIARDAVNAKRREAEAQMREALVEERSLRQDRATLLLDEIAALNAERLGLLAHLSLPKRAAITGFTTAGLDQARSEARHLSLILRYHRRIVSDWLGELREGKGQRGLGPWPIATLVVPWLLAAALFVWWRRRSPALLALLEERMVEADRRDRRTSPSPLRKLSRFLRGVHRPVEWLLFFAVTVWLLPSGARELLEVQLLMVIVGWLIMGALVVHFINAVATTANTSGANAGDDVGALRLRSLRLVGWVIIVFVLVRLISAPLVGKGAIYHLAATVSWYAALPVFLILVRWWREVVFTRVDRARRKSKLQAWVLENRSGWKSFFAAMIAAVQLFLQGSFRAVRNWVGSFYLARRAHAYLFKRELDRLTSDKPSAAAVPLNPDAFGALAPDRMHGGWVACPADAHLATVRRRIVAGGGGVVALIGGRGSGKSSLLRELEARVAGATRLTLAADTSVESLAAAFAAAPTSHPLDASPPQPPALVLVDDVYGIIKPVIGGLAGFDTALAFARANSLKTVWVFAIDGAVWPLLRRARDARPLFDDILSLAPWTDEQIGGLLLQRSAESSVVPLFDELVEALPPTADELDWQDALNAKRAGYFRMVWDYARGNPGISLEVWRSSLFEASDGKVRVRSLSTPEASELDALPDSSLFILRAILQIGPATVADVAQATRLSEEQILSAYSFGHAHGYLVDSGGRILVSWRWLRAVVHLLERRHLLVAS